LPSLVDTSDKYKEKLIMILSTRLKAPVTTSASHFNELILILNPNSQGGATGKNWNNTYKEIKEYLPKRHKVVFTKKADNDGVL
jgi:hypothetical protein